MGPHDPLDRADRLSSRQAETEEALGTMASLPGTGVPRARWKRADTTSAVGAGVLGAGIGILFQRWLGPFAIALLLLGLVMHAWGMYDKHRLESGVASGRLWWAEMLYWGCWIGLLALGLYAVLTVL